MTAVYASTSPAWLTAVKSLSAGVELAFWQPTPARPSRIKIGDRWYFKELGRPVIHGFGLFERWETLSLAELLRMYGEATGYSSSQDLVGALKKFRGEAELGTHVGNVVLIQPTFFTFPVPLATVGWNDLSVPFRYVEGIDPLQTTEADQSLSHSSDDEFLTQSQETSGPTTGVTPSNWTSEIGQSSDDAAFLYALRFGAHNIWKVGWAMDVEKRLKSINDHIPTEVIKEKWNCVYKHRLATKTMAFRMEQHTLRQLTAYRTVGERVNCSDKVFNQAWATMLAACKT